MRSQLDDVKEDFNKREAQLRKDMKIQERAYKRLEEQSTEVRVFDNISTYVAIYTVFVLPNRHKLISSEGLSIMLTRIEKVESAKKLEQTLRDAIAVQLAAQQGAYKELEQESTEVRVFDNILTYVAINTVFVMANRH